jgi:hypothetical protein
MAMNASRRVAKYFKMKSSLLTSPSHPVQRPFTPLIPRRSRVHASENGAPSKPVVSEDVLSKLRAAEEEAAKLRQELAEARAKAGPKADLVGSAASTFPSTSNVKRFYHLRV